MLTIGRRLDNVDPQGELFPRVVDCFFDMTGYTVEALIEGRNCLEVSRSDPTHFQDFKNLRVVATGSLRALVLLAKAGVVHCDLKPDNIMWIAPTEANPEPSVKVVDFGC